MSKSAKQIVKDFDAAKDLGVPPDGCDDWNDWLWKMLNESIDYLREHVELGILT